MPKYKVLRAMFDIRPVNESGSVEFDKLTGLSDTVTLRQVNAPGASEIVLDFEMGQDTELNLDKPAAHSKEAIPEKCEKKNIPGIDILKEFEREMANNLDFNAEFARAGAVLYETKDNKPRKQVSVPYETVPVYEPHEYEPPENLPIANLIGLKKHRKILPKAIPDRQSPEQEKTFIPPPNKSKDEALNVYLNKKASSPSPVERELEVLLRKLKAEGELTLKRPVAFYGNRRFGLKKLSLGFLNFFSKKNRKIWIILPVLALGIFAQKVVNIKNNVLLSGNLAVINLEEARTNLENLDFISATGNFTLASKNFSQASEKLNLIGASFLSIFADVPGLSKIKSAHNLVRAGEAVALAGESLASAFSEFSQTNFISYFGSENLPNRPLSGDIYRIRDSLIFAGKKMDEAENFLENINPSILPEDKREAFLSFKEKTPQFKGFIENAANYSDFLLGFIGEFKHQRYLILFQNNSELRPTGGFPGTYGILEFEKGRVTKIFVEDIYNSDGQISKNIIPPKELQHITPTWGMRDANWFANFPDSARKIVEMYRLNGGLQIDGVLTITPTVITRILQVIGSIEMPEYEMSLNADNFLALVQEEVEYGDNRVQPKSIVADFTPLFLDKLAHLERDKWVEIFDIVSNSIAEKHILAYFQNRDLQKVVSDNNIAGEIKRVDGDFLMVTFTNIKGSKADAVTENSIEIETRITAGGLAEHTLKITRVHKGGRTPYGFYNRQNPAFVRVMVPAGSELLEIRGNSPVSPQQLVRYDGSFEIDKNLQDYESQAVSEKGIKVLKESGKAVFGFWMLTDPGRTKTVTLKYLTPVSVENGEYSLLVQKQPGTIDDKFNFRFELPQNSLPIYVYPDNFQAINKTLVLDSNLLTDRNIFIRYK